MSYAFINCLPASFSFSSIRFREVPWSDRFEGPSQGCKAFGGSTASFFRQQDLSCCRLLLALRGIEVR